MDFNDCVEAGGRITTVTEGEQYRAVCTLEGKEYNGVVMDKQTAKQKRRMALSKKVKNENKAGNLKDS